MDANCTRCKGKGRGDWAPENGICHGCRGVGTRAAQIARRDAAAAELRRITERETVSILVGPVDETEPHAADIAYYTAFYGPDRSNWNGGSLRWVRLAPGWYAAEQTMHVESTLEWLAK